MMRLLVATTKKGIMIELHSRRDKGLLVHGTDRVMRFPAGEQNLVAEAPGTEHPFLTVTRNQEGRLTLIERATPEQEAASELQVAWEDGKPVRTQSFEDVRAVLRKELEVQR